jgi:flagellar export protein FliJ
MKRFRFKLQALLDIKIRTEDRIKRKLAEENAKVMAAGKALAESNDRLKQFQALEKNERMKAVTAGGLRASINYRFKLQGDIAGAGKQILDLKQSVQSMVRMLMEAKKETKALEILRDKKLAEWKHENKLHDQEFTDDVSQKGFIRKTRDAAQRVSQ